MAKYSGDDQSKVIGIISTAPGVLLGGFGHSDFMEYKQVPVALVGRVPVKVSTENGVINPGDRISILPSGFGAKALTSGQSIGIAVEPFPFERKETDEETDKETDEIQTGKVLVFVNLGYYKLTVSEGEDNYLNSITLEDVALKQSEFEERISFLELKLNEAGILDGFDEVNGEVISEIGSSDDSSGVLSNILSTFGSIGAKISDGIFSIKQLMTGKIIVERPENDNAKSTIGEAIILAGSTSTEVSATELGLYDKIFVTPELPVSLGVIKRKPGSSFTVGISAVSARDIYFDWWIVGVKPTTDSTDTPLSSSCEQRITYGWNPETPEDAPIGAQSGGECKAFDTSCLPSGFIEVENCSTKNPVSEGNDSSEDEEIDLDDNATTTYSDEIIDEPADEPTVSDEPADEIADESADEVTDDGNTITDSEELADESLIKSDETSDENSTTEDSGSVESITITENQSSEAGSDLSPEENTENENNTAENGETIAETEEISNSTGTDTGGI